MADHHVDELSDAEIDRILERFDQTDPKLQRRIMVQFMILGESAAEKAAIIEDLVMLVRRASVALMRKDPQNNIPKQAFDYLKSKSLYGGSVLRSS